MVFKISYDGYDSIALERSTVGDILLCRIICSSVLCSHAQLSSDLLQGRILSCEEYGRIRSVRSLEKRAQHWGRRGQWHFSIESTCIVFESNAFGKKGKPFPVFHAQIWDQTANDDSECQNVCIGLYSGPREIWEIGFPGHIVFLSVAPVVYFQHSVSHVTRKMDCQYSSWVRKISWFLRTRPYDIKERIGKRAEAKLVSNGYARLQVYRYTVPVKMIRNGALIWLRFIVTSGHQIHIRKKSHKSLLIILSSGTVNLLQTAAVYTMSPYENKKRVGNLMTYNLQ